MHELSRSLTIIAEQPSAVIAWLETVVLTSVLLAIGFWVQPGDPFFLQAGFPWLLLAPLLLGLRYGFIYGLSSGLIILFTLGCGWYFQWVPITSLPTSMVIGLLLVGMLTGGFRDEWNRYQGHLSSNCDYQKARLEAFSRLYHLLKISHDRLEQQLAGSTVSLRNYLAQLYKQMLACALRNEIPLSGIGEQILQVFSQHGWLQMAAIYPVDQASQNLLPAVALLGNPSPVSASNPLLVEALRTGSTVSIATDHQTNQDQVLAVIPLTDITGRIWGVVTVHEMPFIAFQPNHLNLLTVLGGYIGDLLMSVTQSSTKLGTHIHNFNYQLQRSLKDLCHDVPATIGAIAITTSIVIQDSFIQLLCTQCRCLDRIWIRRSHAGHPVLLLLLPLTDAARVKHCFQRLETIVKEKYDLTAGIDMVIHYQSLTQDDTVEGILVQFKSKFQLLEEEENVSEKSNDIVLDGLGIGDKHYMGLLEQS